MLSEGSIEKSNSLFMENEISDSSIKLFKSHELNITTISADKSFGIDTMKMNTGNYSQRLATFMKNSNKLLENMNKNNIEKSQPNNFFYNENTYHLSESPVNTLIELEENLLQFDESNKVNRKYSEMKETSIVDKEIFSGCDGPGNPNNVTRKRNLNAKYNFQEALKIDDLENQMHNLQKQLNEKNNIIKDIELKFQYFQNFKLSKNIIHHNKSTEFGDELMQVDIENKDQMINCLIDYERFFNRFHSECKSNNPFDNNLIINQDRDTLKYSSIEDYDPNNPVALKNKIKDLESQIEDLQEANEVASSLYSTAENVKIEKSFYMSNEKISELIVENKALKNEVQKLRENANLIHEDLLSSKHMLIELENVKLDLLYFKEHNKKIFDENIQLKNIIKKSDWSFNVREKNKGYKKQKQLSADKLNELFNHPLTDFDQNVNKSLNSLNCDNFSYKKENNELSNDSTDSILSDVNKEIDFILTSDTYIKKVKQGEIHNAANDEIIPLLSNEYENLIFTNKELLKRNSKKLCCENLPYQSSKFSTLGRTAFAPRSGTDININDVIKFIRQGGRISKGLVHFIGRLPKRSDIYLGIELEIEEGKHDGIYEGIRYFHCQEKKGVFVAFNKVIMVYSKNIDR